MGWLEGASTNVVEPRRSTLDSLKDTVKGTIGGLKVNRKNLWMYGQGSGKPGMRELYGIEGPMHFGVPKREHLVLEALSSDSRTTLIRELTDAGISKKEAEDTLAHMLKEGQLKVIKDEDLGEVIVRVG